MEKALLSFDLACRLFNRGGSLQESKLNPSLLEETSPGNFLITGPLPDLERTSTKDRKKVELHAVQKKTKSKNSSQDSPKPKLVNIHGESPPPWLKIPYNSKGIYKMITERLTYNSEGKCTNASRILRNPYFLKLAYESIRANPGNSTRGSDFELLDGIPRTWFHSTSKKLRTGNFSFRPSRRVWIPKPHGGLRPLGIASPRDKIVQQSARLVMEHVLNPKFLECSTGFRPKRGCHTALKQIRSWSRVSWFVEGDIKKFLTESITRCWPIYSKSTSTTLTC